MKSFEEMKTYYKDELERRKQNWLSDSRGLGDSTVKSEVDACDHALENLDEFTRCRIATEVGFITNMAINGNIEWNPLGVTKEDLSGININITGDREQVVYPLTFDRIMGAVAQNYGFEVPSLFNTRSMEVNVAKKEEEIRNQYARPYGVGNTPDELMEEYQQEYELLDTKEQISLNNLALGQTSLVHGTGCTLSADIKNNYEDKRKKLEQMMDQLQMQKGNTPSM